MQLHCVGVQPWCARLQGTASVPRSAVRPNATYRQARLTCVGWGPWTKQLCAVPKGYIVRQRRTRYGTV